MLIEVTVVGSRGLFLCIVYYNPAQENNYGQGSTEGRNKTNSAVNAWY